MDQESAEEIAMSRWNDHADQYNQWCELGRDEKNELINAVKLEFKEGQS